MRFIQIWRKDIKSWQANPSEFRTNKTELNTPFKKEKKVLVVSVLWQNEHTSPSLVNLCQALGRLQRIPIWPPPAHNAASQTGVTTQHTQTLTLRGTMLLIHCVCRTAILEEGQRWLHNEPQATKPDILPKAKSTVPTLNTPKQRSRRLVSF